LAKFTPGSWWIEKSHKSYNLFIDAANRGICQLIGKANSEREANAHLIAAAPEMYELLKQLSVASTLELRKKATDLIKNLDLE
jgi:hypothetical protein